MMMVLGKKVAIFDWEWGRRWAEKVLAVTCRFNAIEVKFSQI